MYRVIVITPAQTFDILKSLTNILHHTLVLTCAATALRSSEILALRWADILWEEERIRVSKRWVKGKDGETKTEASDGYLPLHPVLAHYLHGGTARRPTRRTWILFFRPSRRAAVFPYPLPHSLLIISGRQRKRPGCRSRTARGSDLTTFGTRLQLACEQGEGRT